MKFKKHVRQLTLGLIVLCLASFYSCKTTKKTEEQQKINSPFFKLSLAQWSLNKQIKSGEMSPIDFAQKANELGFTGIEYVSQLYSSELKKGTDPNLAMQNLLNVLKEKSKTYNVQNLIIMVDGEGNLGAANQEKRQEAVDNHKKWVDAAAFLGCHSIRVNANGSGSKEEVTVTVVDGLKKLGSYASQKNINVIIENHGGYSSDAKWLTNVISKTGMKNVGTLPDFGNFCLTEGVSNINSDKCDNAYDIYKGVEEMMPFAKAVSAKSYDFDAYGNQPKIDYKKMLQIIKDTGYTGFIGVEYEGNNLSEEEGIMATKKLLINSAKQLN